jgi:hemolysin activation/secretion protein
MLRGTFTWEAAVSTGAARAVYAAMRAERVSLGGGAIPAEELRFLGGGEGLRGHRDRAFAGDRVVAMTLEHRWVTGPRGGRVFLFVDGARHDLGVPVEAGSARAISDFGASLARTELSPGWEFGYGAGLRSPIRAGTVGIELGFKPGAPLRESKLHLRYSTDW